MAKEPLIAFSVAFGDAAKAEATNLEQTFHFHHPEIPFFIFSEAEYNAMVGEGSPSWYGELSSYHAVVGWFLSNFYERVICFDSDMFVLGKLDDIIQTSSPILLTEDVSAYTMRLHELPVLNSGLLSVANPDFWQKWIFSQFAYLLPAHPKFFFDQISLRLLAASGAVAYEVLDEEKMKRFYNVRYHEYSGEFRAEGLNLFKGDAQILIYHMAGFSDRSVEKLFAPVREVVQKTLENKNSPSKNFNFGEAWKNFGEKFIQQIQGMMEQMPLLKFDRILDELYEQTPGYYRSAAPLSWDKHRNLKNAGFQRILNTEGAHFYIYQESSK